MAQVKIHPIDGVVLVGLLSLGSCQRLLICRRNEMLPPTRAYIPIMRDNMKLFVNKQNACNFISKHVIDMLSIVKLENM